MPDDVRLVMKPSRRASKTTRTLLHEAGHAEHYANVDRTLAFAYRWLGDASVTESYAFLLEYLTTDRLWLRRHLAYEQPETLLNLVGLPQAVFPASLRYEAAVRAGAASRGRAQRCRGAI